MTNGNLITIEDDKRPRVVCPHCKEHILIDFEPFKKDVTKIMRDDCPKCRGTVYVGLMILAHSDLRQLALSIQVVIDALKPKNRIIG